MTQQGSTLVTGGHRAVDWCHVFEVLAKSFSKPTGNLESLLQRLLFHFFDKHSRDERGRNFPFCLSVSAMEDSQKVLEGYYEATAMFIWEKSTALLSREFNLKKKQPFKNIFAH